jgi:ribosomal-protein-alanine N-acetyltransferase
MKARVRLQPVRAGDEAEFLAAVARSRSLHGRWVMPPTTPARFATLVDRMQGPLNHGFVVRRSDSGALVGWIELTNIVRGVFLNAYVGYYAFAGQQGQGLMREGLQLAARQAFGPLRLHRLEANIQPENSASIALVQACGFEREGFSPRYLKIRGRWRDHERWALLAR